MSDRNRKQMAERTVSLMEEYDEKLQKLSEAIDHEGLMTKKERIEELNEERCEIGQEIKELVKNRINALTTRQRVSVGESLTIRDNDIWVYGHRRTANLEKIIKNLNEFQPKHFTEDERWEEFKKLKNALQKLDLDYFRTGDYKAGNIFIKYDFSDEAKERVPEISPRFREDFDKVEQFTGFKVGTNNLPNIKMLRDTEKSYDYNRIRIHEGPETWDEHEIVAFLCYQDEFHAVMDKLIELSEEELENRKEIKEEVDEAGKQYAFADSLAI